MARFFDPKVPRSIASSDDDRLPIGDDTRGVTFASYDRVAVDGVRYERSLRAASTVPIFAKDRRTPD